MSLPSPASALLWGFPASAIAAWTLGRDKGWKFTVPICLGGTLTFGVTMFYLRIRSLRRSLVNIGGTMMPGEAPSIPYGNMAEITRHPRSSMLDMHRRHGDIYVHWKMWLPIVTVATVDAAKYICSGAFDRIPDGDVFPPLFRRFLKGSIFYAGGERHKIMRRIMAPLFVRHETFEVSANVAGHTARKFALDMKERALSNGGSFQIDGTELVNLGFEMVKQCLFEGIGFTESDEHALLLYIEAFMGLMKNPLCWLPFFHLLPLRSVRDFLRWERAAHEVIAAAIDRVRSRPESHLQAQHPRVALLEQLVRAADSDTGISDFELRQNTLTLLTAGSQDAGNTLLHVCVALAKYSDAQDKVAEEARRELHGEMPTVELLKQLQWCDSCVKEALRMFPHMNMLWTKTATKEVAVCGFKIPALVPLTVDVTSLHYDERVWPEPTRFDPSRFGECEGATLAHHACSNMPFGAGTRMCVAYKMGPVLIKAALGTLMQHLRFELSNSAALDSELGFRGYMDLGIEEQCNLFSISPR